MTPEKIKAIQADYEAITDFRNNGLDKLAEKHNVTISEVMEVIDL